MDPNAMMGMIFTLILTILIGGFILLFPIARRLGALLESKVASEKKGSTAPLQADVRRLGESIESLESEVRALKERQEFTEKVIAARDRPKLPSEPSA